MRTCFKAALIYMLAATLTLVLLHDSAVETLVMPLRVAELYAGLVLGAALYLVPLAVLLMWWLGRRTSREHLTLVFIAAIFSVLLQVGFLLFKSAIPILVPFYADPFLATMEHTIFLGHDAWQIAHAVTPGWLAASFPLIYLTLWTVLAVAFPVVVAASDPDRLRVDRYFWLFLLSWIIVGNLLALAGSSVGPIFYDRLLGTDRFAELHVALAQSGFATGPIAQVQENLWRNLGGLLSCISAFPSVHVAVACIAALYIRERFRSFRLAGDVFLALVLLISVYSGYHYLVDGVASIAVVLALNAALIRRQNRRRPVASGIGLQPEKGEAALNGVA
jgi:hypothetical protein